jgi:hypothetical protein
MHVCLIAAGNQAGRVNAEYREEAGPQLANTESDSYFSTTCILQLFILDQDSQGSGKSKSKHGTASHNSIPPRLAAIAWQDPYLDRRCFVVVVAAADPLQNERQKFSLDTDMCRLTICMMNKS